MKCRPCKPRGMAGRHRGPGHIRYMTAISCHKPTWWTLSSSCSLRSKHWSSHRQARQRRPCGLRRFNPDWWRLRQRKYPSLVGRQVGTNIDAIVRSNGWDDATLTLQLLSHLEGDALNVALLVPEVQRTTRIGLVRALTDHYGSPGRLADYRHQFEKTAR